MRKYHGVRLSNGNILVVEEGKNQLHFGLAQQNCDIEKLNSCSVEAYICCIEDGGVRVYANSGDAPYCLSRNLGVQSIAEKIAADYPWGFATGMSGLWQAIEADSAEGAMIWNIYIACKAVLFDNVDAQVLLLKAFNSIAMARGVKAK